MGNLKETLFVFPWEKPFGNHKTCLLMGFSGGNTTRRQQCKLPPTLSYSSRNLFQPHYHYFTPYVTTIAIFSTVTWFLSNRLRLDL